VTISSGTLVPTFATSQSSYFVQVSNAVTSVTFTAVATDSTAIIRVSNVVVASNTASSAQSLVVGNNVVLIAVTAQDGVTVSTYNVTVNRAPCKFYNMFMCL